MSNLILKTLIYVVIFIAIMVVRPAVAAELSRKMLGSWCGQWSWQFPYSDVDDEPMYWWRIEDVEGCGNRGGIRVRERGYDYYRFGPQGSCKLTAIKFRRHSEASDADLFVPADPDEKMAEEAKAIAKAGPPPSDVYTIRAICKTRGKTWNESYDIQTGNNWLKLSPLTPEFPKEYRGTWCIYKNQKTYRRVRNEDSCWNSGADDLMVIKARWFGFAQHSSRCEPSIPKDESGELHVEAKCRYMDGGREPWPMVTRWKLLDGGRRLRVIWPEEDKPMSE